MPAGPRPRREPTDATDDWHQLRLFVASLEQEIYELLRPIVLFGQPITSAISPRQDLNAYLIVLRAAIATHGAPEVVVSDGGGVFKANHARAIYAASGCRGLGATQLIWIASSGSVPLASSIRTGASGSGIGASRENGGSLARAAVWVWDETLTIEHAAETLAQYRVAVEADGRRLRGVAAPRFFQTSHVSPQPFLAPLEETEWHPAQRVAPYRPRRKRVTAEQQSPLPEPDRETASG